MNDLEKIIFSINKYNYKDIHKQLPCDIDKNDAIEELNYIKNNMLNGTIKRNNKLLIHMAGIPGSGKTTYSRSILNNFKKNEILYLDFDDVMEQISYYKIEKEENNRESFKRWEIPARILGYEVLHEAFKNDLSVLFDNGATNPKHIQILKIFKKNGYRLKMFYLKGTPDQCDERIDQREKETKRYFPKELINFRYTSLIKNIKTYKKLVDEFYEIKCNKME